MPHGSYYSPSQSNSGRHDHFSITSTKASLDNYSGPTFYPAAFYCSYASEQIEQLMRIGDEVQAANWMWQSADPRHVAKVTK